MNSETLGHFYESLDVLLDTKLKLRNNFCSTGVCTTQGSISAVWHVQNLSEHMQAFTQDLYQQQHISLPWCDKGG